MLQEVKDSKRNKHETIDEAKIKKHSAKSMHNAIITVIAVLFELSTFDVCYRTGHLTGACLDSYIDASDPIGGLAAMNVQHGRAAKSKIVLPNLSLIVQGMEDGGLLKL